jgi:hypothetical protein
MPKFIDLTGQRFGQLVVVRRGEDYTPGVPRWTCRCDCGAEALVHAQHLRSGNTKSCGCGMGAAHYRHGGTIGKKTTYKSWESARRRCSNPKDNMYRYYGGRGITICPEWAADYAAFLRDMGERPEGHSLDRIDFNGNYEPGNCRWLPKSEQPKNRRSLVRIEHEGRTMLLSEWARELGLPYPTIRDWWKYQRIPFDEIVRRRRT